jgi:hypothetical protein
VRKIQCGKSTCRQGSVFHVPPWVQATSHRFLMILCLKSKSPRNCFGELLPPESVYSSGVCMVTRHEGTRPGCNSTRSSEKLFNSHFCSRHKTTDGISNETLWCGKDQPIQSDFPSSTVSLRIKPRITKSHMICLVSYDTIFQLIGRWP